MSIQQISVCILTKNSRETLRKALESVSEFPEVVLLDNESSDNTIETAKQYPNVKIYHSPFLGFGKLRNLAAEKALFDWIFFLDSDEVVSKELLQTLKETSLQEDTVYGIERRNFFNGKWIRGCGWSPDVVYRIYHKRKTCYQEQKVHESLDLTQCKRCICLGVLLHTPYRRTEDFLDKMQRYSTLFQEQNQNSKRSTVFKAVYKSLFTFFRSFIIKKGFLDGKEGFIISLYNAHSTYYKYLKLALEPPHAKPGDSGNRTKRPMAG